MVRSHLGGARDGRRASRIQWRREVEEAEMPLSWVVGCCQVALTAKRKVEKAVKNANAATFRSLPMTMQRYPRSLKYS